MPFQTRPHEHPTAPASAKGLTGAGAAKTIESERKGNRKPKFRVARQGRRGRTR